MAGKRFYWIKLKENFFDDPAIDWIREQENGAEYILIYQMLCLKSMNNGGVLTRSIGQLVVPYEPKKIAEITKSKLDSVIVALELFKKTGLMEVLDGGELYLTAVEEMTGSESSWAGYKRNQRGRKLDNVQGKLDNVQGKLDNVQGKLDNVLTMSHKRIDIDIDIEKEKDIDIEGECEREKKPKPKTKKQAFSARAIIEDYTSNDELIEVLSEFVDMRKNIKKPISTASTLKRLFNKLDKFSGGDDSKKIILLNASIDHCWQDVYEKSLEEYKQANKTYDDYADDENPFEEYVRV